MADSQTLIQLQQITNVRFQAPRALMLLSILLRAVLPTERLPSRAWIGMVRMGLSPMSLSLRLTEPDIPYTLKHLRLDELVSQPEGTETRRRL